MEEQKKKFEKHVIKPDHVYGSIFIQRFINCVMRKGKKRTAEKIVYKTLAIIKENLKKPALEIFEVAIKNVSPKIRLVSTTYYAGRKILFPRQVSVERSEWQALK
jgi:small subunit ribosomal protein S7